LKVVSVSLFACARWQLTAAMLICSKIANEHLNKSGLLMSLLIIAVSGRCSLETPDSKPKLQVTQIWPLPRECEN
jgi:hypothetical protein